MTVYSTRFMQALGATGPNTFTVPAGFVAVIRSVQAYINSTGESDLFLQGALSQALVWVHASPGDRIYNNVDLRAVLNESETMKVTISVGSFDAFDYSVSGYLLAA